MKMKLSKFSEIDCFFLRRGQDAVHSIDRKRKDGELHSSRTARRDSLNKMPSFKEMRIGDSQAQWVRLFRRHEWYAENNLMSINCLDNGM
jgi:hypothetical protein